MNDVTTGSWDKLKPVSYLVCLVVGLGLGLYGSDKLYHPGCALKLSLSGLETSCPSPYEVPLSFGEQPSTRPLSEALKIVQDRTQGTGQARVYIDQEVLDARFATARVHPPSGSQPSLGVVRQLLDEAHASRMADICLAPSEGFRVQLSNTASGAPTPSH
jgi:hypothetical protein